MFSTQFLLVKIEVAMHVNQWPSFVFLFVCFFLASLFLKQNILSLIEGSRATYPACALATVTGIPLIRLRATIQPYESCKNAVHMTPGYMAYAHASLDILNTFHWINVALVFDGKSLHIVK